MKIYGAQLTGSIASKGNPVVTGSLTVSGNLTAQQFIVSSSVTFLTTSFSSGSTRFGDSSDDNHNFTGSLIVSGSANPFKVGSNLLFVSSSGNVGIGTTTPFGKFNVVAGTNKSLIIQDSGTADTTEMATYSVSGGTRNLQINAANLIFGTGTSGGSSSTERMRITSDGNVGIGVVPSAWSTITALQIKNGFVGGTDKNVYLGSNAYYDGSIYRYSSTGFANLYYQDSNTNDHVWYNSPTGTAGNSVTFSERMRITSDGYLRLSSKGIQFNGDTSDVNSLDDYEEGTWTPTLPNGGTLGVYGARYVKIGQQVTVSFYIYSISPPNNSSDFLIGGLPFPNAGYSTFYSAGSFGYVDTGNLSGWLPITGLNYSYIYFHSLNGGSAARKSNANYLAVAAGSNQMIVTITYFAAS
jgi:hypothetical protein